LKINLQRQKNLKAFKVGEEDMFEDVKTTDELFEMYQARFRRQEEKQDEIGRTLRQFERQEDEFEDLRTEMRFIIRELPDQWEEERFYNEIDQYEDDFHQCHICVMLEMEDKKEELLNCSCRLYDEEEEYHSEYKRARMSLKE
jgi:hypothetical protein